MALDVHHICTEDFFVSFNIYLAFLGFKDGQKDVHYTFSYNPDSEEANFHIARNASDPKDKPKITIAIINKAILERELTKLSKNLFQLFFEPLSISKLLKRPKTGYHSPPFRYLIKSIS